MPTRTDQELILDAVIVRLDLARTEAEDAHRELTEARDQLRLLIAETTVHDGTVGVLPPLDPDVIGFDQATDAALHFIRTHREEYRMMVARLDQVKR